MTVERSLEQPRRWLGPAVSALPVALPAGMRALFPLLTNRLGMRRGYIASFGCYWSVCLVLPLALLGVERVSALFRCAARPLPAPRAVALAALLAPPTGAALTELRPEIRRGDPQLVAAALAIAVVNATAEELLWRGLPLAVFPDDRLRGWLLPATGFTAWHLAPLSAFPSTRTKAFLTGAAAIGLGSGWIARNTGSLRLTLAAHVATDACGLRAARFWLGRQEG